VKPTPPFISRALYVEPHEGGQPAPRSSGEILASGDDWTSGVLITHSATEANSRNASGGVTCHQCCAALLTSFTKFHTCCQLSLQPKSPRRGLAFAKSFAPQAYSDSNDCSDYADEYLLGTARRIGQADQREAGSPANNDYPAAQSLRSLQ
jgi:hypothetical protein